MNYYNEIDPSAAAWLAALMADKLIPHGHIDTRSICDVQPGDLEGYTQCHFFAGIAGWSLALKLAGWPETRPVWTGSCPCQPFSDAGKGLGEADPRHLWPYFRNLIGVCRPAVVFGEQVGSKAGRLWLSRVRSDFQNAAYAFGAADLAAASLGAPHKRQRLFWVADSTHTDRRSRERIPQEGTGQDGQRRRGPAIGGANGRLDDTAGARLQPEGQRPEGEARDQARLRRPERRRTISSRLGYAILPGLEVRSGGSQDDRPPEETSSATQLSMFGCGLGNSPCSGSAGADGSSEQEQGPGTGSVHAFWRDTRWIPTTDPRTGKTVMRRIPLEPGFQSVVNGLSGSVASLWPEGLIKLQKKVIAYASHVHKNHAEALRSLWEAVCAQDQNRIANGVCSQAILLSALLQLARQMGQSQKDPLQQGFSEVPEELLRSLRDSPEESQAVARSSPGFGLDQQRFPQLADLVHELSHEAAQCAKAVALYTSMTLFPLSQRLPGRVGILRGAGNAIVPQVAAQFIQAYLETL